MGFSISDTYASQLEASPVGAFNEIFLALPGHTAFDVESTAQRCTFGIHRPPEHGAIGTSPNLAYGRLPGLFALAGHSVQRFLMSSRGVAQTVLT